MKGLVRDSTKEVEVADHRPRRRAWWTTKPVGSSSSEDDLNKEKGGQQEREKKKVVWISHVLLKKQLCDDGNRVWLLYI